VLNELEELTDEQKSAIEALRELGL
jgi:hypothetical protein